MEGRDESMSLPFSESQCFFVAMLVFVVVGFQRGWRKELVSLVFVLLAVFLVRPDSGKVFLDFVARLVGSIVYIFNPQSAPQTNSIVTPASSYFGGPLGALLIFAGVMALGYFVGNKAFPGKPAATHDRFIGIVPALVSGAFVLAFLRNFLSSGGNAQSSVTVAVSSPDPGSYIPTIFVVAIVALVVALIAARAKKAPAKK